MSRFFFYSALVIIIPLSPPPPQESVPSRLERHLFLRLPLLGPSQTTCFPRKTIPKVSDLLSVQRFQ